MFLVDWAVKMRIRPPEFETSICDAKYHVSLSTRSVLGKCVYLVTLVMSLFDLQDVCIAIGSIATLDLPNDRDLIGIYGLKGPYRTLTTTNWFLQALTVIPRGSWGHVARRSYHDPMDKSGIVISEKQWFCGHPSPPLSSRRRPPCAAAAARLRQKFVSGQFDEENPFVLISSVLLVQADEGISFLVVYRIGDIYRNLPRRADIIVTTVGARHKCQQDIPSSQLLNPSTAECILYTADLLYVQISTVHKISTVHHLFIVHQLSTDRQLSTVHFQLISAHLVETLVT
ncbi:hypothetical protein F511_39609 [Dorcoceras hygrometricum]|uniref:Uncharacterized protein n=1 Tax=Dorcoceras hygrometricum TaxID=472368 RepID=A0A2Z7AP16_9LAMI|nr:hypothetical protein F511_39609 [Dorcoceras hygrometricum]